MRITIVDTDILIDTARGIAEAVEFLKDLETTASLAVSVITQMELTVGCRNKNEYSDLKKFLLRFEILPINSDISNAAVELLNKYNLSHGLLIPDALIAATAISLGEPLSTKNQRDFRFIDGLNLLKYA